LKASAATYKTYGRGADNSWVEIPSDLMCYTSHYDCDFIHSCDLFIKTEVNGLDMSHIMVEATAAEVSAVAKTESRMVENSNMSVEYTRQEDERSMFTVTDKISGVSSDMAFSLKTYNPATGNDDYSDTDNVASGAYIFKPKRGDMLKAPYTDFVNIETYNTTNTGIVQHVIYYSDAINARSYIGIIHMKPNATTVEWEVQLHGIPVSKTDKLGKEVVVNWEMMNFNSSNTFYTDSNGLEMQKRVLNQRPDFTYTTDEMASSNYYPINSAIAIRNLDNNMQLTVMNDRSQGGAVLEDGSIEIMQNRRLLHDDGRGVGEPLDEVDAAGEGIEVNTRYFLQYFDFTKTASNQRAVQRMIDEPIAFFVSKVASTEELTLGESSVSAAAYDTEFVGDLKIHLIPEGRNKILIRVENIADLFDGAPAATPQFDIRSYACSLYDAANPTPAANACDV